MCSVQRRVARSRIGPLGQAAWGITVAMDWTELDEDGQATIMLSLLSRDGRATPLVWMRVDKEALKKSRNGYEYEVLVRLAENLRADVRVRVVADRGFGDHELYRVLLRN